LEARDTGQVVIFITHNEWHSRRRSNVFGDARF